MKVVGVFGVSGVGKTTLIGRAIAGNAAWVRVSAGSLVQEYRPQLDRDELRALPTAGLDENQEAIIVGLRKKRECQESGVILFDGHLVLDSGKELFEVSLDVVRQLQLDAITVVRDQPPEVMARRFVDSSRARAVRSIQEIAAEQDATIELGASYAHALGIAFAIVSPNQERDLIGFIEALQC